MKVSATRFDVRRYGDVVERHAHDHHQIVLPLTDAGALEMEIGSQRDGVTGNRAALIPSGMPHGFAAAADNRFLIADLPATDAGAQFWSAVADAPFVKFDPVLSGLVNFIAANVGEAGFGGLRATVAGDMVVDALARGAGLDAEPLARPLARAIDFIDRHLADPITIAAIARESGLSESRLHAHFRERFHVSPKRYVSRLRLQKAAALLEGSSASIAEVALAVGYGDQSAFTRAFVRAIGETPAEYRRHRRERD